jgi:hypothetical protein
VLKTGLVSADFLLKNTAEKRRRKMISEE